MKSYCKESNIPDTSWLRYLFSVCDVITGLICIFENLEYLRNDKRYLKVVNSIILLIQATCLLCFKMASIGKMRFSS